MNGSAWHRAALDRLISNRRARMRVKIPGPVELLVMLAWVAFAMWPATAAFAGKVLPGSYAWGENVGWLNALPLGPSGPGLDVGGSAISGYLWGENVGWISFSCTNDASCGTVSYGVARDAAGKLSGYAWGENTGWVSLSCQNTGSCGSASYGVTVDPYSGAFSGFAWGENVGWISFSCVNTATCSRVPFGVQVFVPLPVPALSPGGMTVLALAVLLFALFRIGRRKRAA